MEELVEILTEDGVPTGQAQPRSVAHSQGLWHKTVHIYLYRILNSEVELLVHLRSKTKDLNPNKWDRCFGGHVKFGDTVEKTIENELQEEAGIQVERNHLMAGQVYKNEKFPNNEFMAVYFYEFNSDPATLTFNDGEVQQVKWMKIFDMRSSMKNCQEQWVGTEADLIEIKELL